MRQIHAIVICFNLLVIGVDLYTIIEYRSEPYLAFIYFTFYFGLPAFFLDLFIIIYYSYTKQPKKRLGYGVFFALVVILPFIVFFIMESSRGWLPIFVKNTTDYPLEKLELLARNQQYFQKEKLYSSDQVDFNCKCLEPSIEESDTLGIELFYEIDGTKKRLFLVNQEDVVFADTLRIQILDKDHATVNGQDALLYP
ncbi:hypothetical protein QNI19_26185 [Cytophagaceae bacterium DM2B3-1]|uniref:Uncharacterized protein n=1 Tax=Xanthocytophaga flava TaxID=3048013 RepID=A0ABT7CRV1_9BACT|nr:hypothetical protein [Xanthocytophaga flavus]MDJ1496452.1 hypothetical protein [Xanthocytophaga flavus]